HGDAPPLLRWLHLRLPVRTLDRVPLRERLRRREKILGEVGKQTLPNNLHRLRTQQHTTRATVMRRLVVTVFSDITAGPILPHGSAGFEVDAAHADKLAPSFFPQR